MFCRACGSTRNLTAETRAVKKDETITPERIRASLVTSPWVRAMAKARPAAKRPPAKAMTCTGSQGIKPIVTAQPKAAPEEMPRM
ncbi:MAG: hypothetical protein BWY87_00854 [Deltaproteobacteria bacterium ADurb.Bin510]|nr:MAG: hypothetical protein BWY87_00854 [Deltaproteobacteria bacterium ADurb.Bin510]